MPDSNHINKMNQVNGGNAVAAHNGMKNQNTKRKRDSEDSAPSTKKQKTVQPTGIFKPPPPVGAGGGYMFSGRPSVPLSVVVVLCFPDISSIC